MKHLKIPDWCSQLCTDITVHFRKCSKWGNNFQSIFKHAAVKVFCEIIQSPFPKELWICVLCICGQVLRCMDLYKYVWENDVLVILPTVVACRGAFFFSITHTASFDSIQALIILFSQKPCVTWFYFVRYVQIFRILLQNVSGPNPVIHW